MTLPFISVLVPAHNEAAFIANCLRSILANDYPRDRMEVLVIDGMSNDGTREIVRAIAADSPSVKLLDNPRRITPVALNIGIRHARGELINWMGAHNVYQPDYLRRCAESLLAYGADHAGGGIITVARGRGRWDNAVVAALGHPFGVGNSQFRTATGAGKPRWADTVFGGCYRREVFERLGLFNERLVRGQDMEFNLRMGRAGLRTLFVPTITSEYLARTRPVEFVRHTFTNGVWVIVPFAHSEGMPVSFRHLFPLAFVSVLASAGVVAVFHPLGWWLISALLLAHLGVAAVASLGAARRLGGGGAALMPAAFLLLHLSYGLGSLWGTAVTLVNPYFWRKLVVGFRSPYPKTWSRSPRFEDLTETTGIPISREGADMMYTRYRVAADLAKNRRVLEIGCGAGQGLGMVGQSARSVVGADRSLPLLRSGRRHYGARVPFVRLTAERLPFRDGAFDLALFFEASYYVPDMRSALQELARVLAPGGTVLFVNANPERPDFIRSPHSVHYHTADEFRKALEEAGFLATVAGAFPVESSSRTPLARALDRLTSAGRRLLEALGLVPRTLRGRARLKRCTGRLVEVPAEIVTGSGTVSPRIPLPPGPVRDFKVLYVQGERLASIPPRPALQKG